MTQDPQKLVSRLKMRHLSAILAIARSGSLQKASESLALSQSAISKTLREAEELVGATLFERTPTGSRATLFGEILVRYSAKVTTDMRQAGDEFQALLKGESGKLTIGVFTPMAWWGALSRCIYDFQRVAPLAKLTLRQGSMEELFAALEAGDLDVVLGRWAEVHPERLQSEALLDDGGPKFVARGNHPLAVETVTLDQLVAYPWFLPEAPNFLLTALHGALSAAGLTLPNRVVYSHVYTINLAICEHTDMIAILPAFAIPEVGALYGLRKLNFELPFNTLPLSAFWRGDRKIEPATRRFIDRLKEICQEDLAPQSATGFAGARAPATGP